MLRISRLTDYAVVLLAEMARLASRPGETAPATVAGLARATPVPEPTAAKVLKRLTRGGVVRSRRGKAGGYSLAAPATEITVGQIVEAMEGPVALTACVDSAPGCCGVESLCSLSGHWNRVNDAVRAALDRVTLAEMARTGLPFDPLEGTLNESRTGSDGRPEPDPKNAALAAEE